MLHPAYLLRNENAKREAWEDLKLLHRLLREKTGDWPPELGRRYGLAVDRHPMEKGYIHLGPK